MSQIKTTKNFKVLEDFKKKLHNDIENILKPLILLSFQKNDLEFLNYIQRLENLQNLNENTKLFINLQYANYYFKNKNYKLAKEYIDKVNEDDKSQKDYPKELLLKNKLMIYSFNEEFDKAIASFDKLSLSTEPIKYQEIMFYDLLKYYHTHKEYKKIKEAVFNFCLKDHNLSFQQFIEVEKLLEESFEKAIIYIYIFLLNGFCNFEWKLMIQYLEKSLELVQSQKRKFSTSPELEWVNLIYLFNIYFFSQLENNETCIQLLTNLLKLIEDKESSIYYMNYYNLCVYEIKTGKNDVMEKLKFVVEKLEPASKIGCYIQMAYCETSSFERENYIDFALKLAKELNDQNLIQIIQNVRKELLNQ